jgi:hypothetical protein
METVILIPIIISAISLGLSLYQFISDKIYKKNERKIYSKRLFSAIRKEVRKNLEIIAKLSNRVTGSKAVYDLIIRNYINELTFNELKIVYDEYPLLIEKNIKSADKIDLHRVKNLIKESCDMIEKLHRDLKIISDEPLVNAPIIHLGQRLRTLNEKLIEIKDTFKIIKLKK